MLLRTYEEYSTPGEKKEVYYYLCHDVCHAHIYTCFARLIRLTGRSTSFEISDTVKLRSLRFGKDAETRMSQCLSVFHSNN